MLNDQGKPLTYKEFCDKFKFKPYITEFYGVKMAMKNMLEKLDGSGINFPITSPILQKYIQCILTNKGNLRVYNLFVESLPIQCKFKSKWSNSLEVNDNDWKIIFTRPFQNTGNVKYRWFQYRIVTRLIATNSLLYKIGIEKSS